MNTFDRKIHTFENGIKVFDDHLIETQRERYKSINLHEPEEELIFTEIIRKISPQGCYVNIGSAIGYYPLLARKIAPDLRIHTFEPLDIHRQHFLENIQLNDFDKGGFMLHSRGIASTCGKTKFAENSYGSSIVKEKFGENNLSFILKSIIKRIIKKDRIIEIDTTTIDSFIDEIGYSIDLCQMDIQGLEIDALTGAKKSLNDGSIQNLLIGTHGERTHKECIRILKAYDYNIVIENSETESQPDGIILASKE